jgi:SAM-dependent methyltransferase
VSEKDRYRLSFGAVAEAYERARPLYAEDALAWLRERLPLVRVLDLGAGTGKLTRQLAALGADVVAVEPDAEMRAVFARTVPGVEVRAGSAEEIPLADESVDTVTAGQAFHWFDLERALPEIHRVLRTGGGVALLWNEWDDDDPLMHDLNEIVARRRVRELLDAEERHPLDDSPLFANRELRTFGQRETLDPEIVVERVSSVSAIVTLAPDERERVLREVRRLVGAGPVPFVLKTVVAVADRG